MQNRISTFARFAAVGAFNTAFGYCLYLILLWIGMVYWLAWGMALTISLALGFVLGGKLVFAPTKLWRFLIYVSAWIALYGFNVMLISVVFKFGISEETGPLLILPLNVALSYVLQKYLVYR
jgi:putative flippase GtrA